MTKHLILLFTSNFYTLSAKLQEEVYYEFYKLVYPLVQFIVRDHGASEDIIQEAFMRAIDKAPQLQDLDKLESWLRTLARNLSLNYLKKLKRNRGELDAEAVFVEREIAASAAASELEEQVESKFMEEAIVRYIDQLRPDYRQVLEMRWIGRMSYRDMAAALATSEAAVRQKLFRAREAIKLKLQEDWGIQ